MNRKAGWVVAGAMMLNAAVWAADKTYPGYVKVENFDAITGGNISDLTGNIKYITNQPDSINLRSRTDFSMTRAGISMFATLPWGVTTLTSPSLDLKTLHTFRAWSIASGGVRTRIRSPLYF